MIQIGEISFDELYEALKKGQPNMQFDKKTVQLLLSQFDKNNDNEISFQEFNDLFSCINEQYNEFLDIDLDSSGYIDNNELEIALRNKGFKMSSKFYYDLVNEIIKRNRLNGISFDIFVRIISRFTQLKNEYKLSNNYKDNYDSQYIEKFYRDKFFLKF
jgi:Ca2+-binding EF-hand superfamily protein